MHAKTWRKAKATSDSETKLIYLGKRREGKAREYSANYHRLLAVVEEMTAINMAPVRLDACD